jgi:hypothetical protein
MNPFARLQEWNARRKVAARLRLVSRLEEQVEEAWPYIQELRHALRMDLDIDALRAGDAQKSYLMTFAVMPTLDIVHRVQSAHVPAVTVIEYATTNEPLMIRASRAAYLIKPKRVSEAQLSWDTAQHEPIALKVAPLSSEENAELLDPNKTPDGTPIAPIRFLFFKQQIPAYNELERCLRELGLEGYLPNFPNTQRLIFEQKNGYSEGDWHRFHYLGDAGSRSIWANNAQVDSSKRLSRYAGDYAQ